MRVLYAQQNKFCCLIETRDVHGNANWDSHGNGNTNMQEMGMGRVHVKRGMGMATFSYVPKFPSVDSMRMESNVIRNLAPDSVNS